MFCNILSIILFITLSFFECSNFLSIVLSFCHSLCVSMDHFFHCFVYHSFSHSIFVSIALSLGLSFYLAIYLLFYPPFFIILFSSLLFSSLLFSSLLFSSLLFSSLLFSSLLFSLRLSVVLFCSVCVGTSRLSAVAVSFSCLEFLISDTKQEVSLLNQCVTHEKVMKREWWRAEMKDGRAVVIIHLFWDFLSFIDWTWDQRMSLIPAALALRYDLVSSWTDGGRPAELTC